VVESFAGFENIGHGLSLFLRNIDSALAHRFNGQRIELPRFQAGAVRFEVIAPGLVQESCGHLAAGAVMDADEQDFLFHDMGPLINRSSPMLIYSLANRTLL